MQEVNPSARRVIGAKIREEVLGASHTRAGGDTPHLFETVFLEFTEDFCWGNVWNRPGLTREVRSMLNLAMLASMGRWNEFEVHTRGAINNGVTEEQISEVLLQAGVYAGIPVAAEGLRRAKSVVSALNAKHGKEASAG
ncbi:carboxymuconolactone decarboxylase family protein [Burkholderia sp. L27(2015)]|uniref:carboxymuconolactone decarboxylase family protein n=1 Tax=Burkholderia sp. L27(2015) TaxID=1641858 RepID=UPI00131CA591|nr:carboxymuconolactone decarboxylase family protein [Burkholderia sp. L27(2015)]